jgi:hypothetical protein
VKAGIKGRFGDLQTVQTHNHLIKRSCTMKKLIMAVLILFALSSVGVAQVKNEQPKSGTKGTASMLSNNAKTTARNSGAVAYRKSKVHHKAMASHRRMTKHAKMTKYAKSKAKKTTSAKKLIKRASANSKKHKELRAKSMRKS